MDRTEAFIILGIAATKEEKALKAAYREKLVVTNPEDDPEGFKRLRSAYEEACRYAEETEETKEEQPRDLTPSGLWVEKAAEIYGNIRTRRDTELWKELFREDVFLSLEEEENCRLKLVGFLMEHFRLPTQVWKLLDKNLSIVKDAKQLREKFPAHFVNYMTGKCQRGEDVEFDQFEGPEDGDYDLFLQCYDRCWNALQEKKYEEAERNLETADKLDIHHPAMEICRAYFLSNQNRTEEAFALLDELQSRYPKDAMVCYNAAEIFWAGKEEAYRARAAEIYRGLKEELDTHYMANVRLTEWYYEQAQYREAKKCAEKVLASGSDEAFMEILGKINKEIEKELETGYRETGAWEPGLELCWCYLQDGKISRGIRLASELEKLLPPEKEAEYCGLMAKLYVEGAEYEHSIAMTRQWEKALERKLEREAGADETERQKDLDRLRQAHLIRMQCCHNLGYRDRADSDSVDNGGGTCAEDPAKETDRFRENGLGDTVYGRAAFALAVKEGESMLSDDIRDVGILLETAQIYMEMEEYEKSLEIAQRLVEDYQVFAAYASSLEVYRRQLNAAGVVRYAGHCIRCFPTFVKSYEYLAKVYLDLDYREEMEKVLEDAEKNGVRSVILDAYRFQMNHEVMDVSVLNEKLKEFRKNFLGFAEKGEMIFYEKGLPVLTEYVYHYPDDFMLVERAIFHRAAHRYQEAREDFEKALYMNPSNPYALNGLSFVYKYLGEYEKALFYIKKAILYMDEEMSPVIFADMGSLYSLLGDYDRALHAFRQYESLTEYNKNGWFVDNLAKYCMHAGKIDEAAEAYKRFYGGNKSAEYEKLVELYNGAGQRDKAVQVLALWKSELGRRRRPGGLFPVLTAQKKSGGEVARRAFYESSGWTELIFGTGRAAIRAFEGMLREGFADSTMEGKLSDVVFACILCGEEKKGRKYSERLRDWLVREKASGGRKYYNREKAYVWMEFLAAYYTEDEDKLQEILDRGDRSEICHFCICPLCKELEGVRILLMLRTGRREEAKNRLYKNLEIQPWDEYMLAVKHIAFEEFFPN